MANGTLDDAFYRISAKYLTTLQPYLTKALSKLDKFMTSNDLRIAFETHLEETQGKISGSSRCLRIFMRLSE